MIRNIIIFFVATIFALFFLPVCFSQSATDTSIGSNTSIPAAGSNKNENSGAAGGETTKEGAEVKKEEKTAEDKKAEKKKEEEKKAKEEEEKKKEEAQEETPPAQEESLDDWGEYAPTDRNFRSEEQPNDIWNDNQGYRDR